MFMTNKPWWAKKHPKRWETIEFHKNFLTTVKEDNGDLWCEYCGKKGLIVYDWWESSNKEIEATVDHFYPSSKYPELRKEIKNFVVSCHKCNNNKKDDLWDIEKISYPRNKIVKINLFKMSQKKLTNNALKQDFYDIVTSTEPINIVQHLDHWVIKVGEIEHNQESIYYHYDDRDILNNDFNILMKFVKLYENSFEHNSIH